MITVVCPKCGGQDAFESAREFRSANRLCDTCNTPMRRQAAAKRKEVLAKPTPECTCVKCVRVSDDVFCLFCHGIVPENYREVGSYQGPEGSGYVMEKSARPFTVVIEGKDLVAQARLLEALTKCCLMSERITWEDRENSLVLTIAPAAPVAERRHFQASLFRVVEGGN